MGLTVERFNEHGLSGADGILEIHQPVRHVIDEVLVSPEADDVTAGASAICSVPSEDLLVSWVSECVVGCEGASEHKRASEVHRRACR